MRHSLTFRLIILGLGLSFLLQACLQNQVDPEPEIRPVGPNEGTIRLINDQFQSESIVVVGSKQLNFVVSFQNPSNESFVAVQNSLPVIMQSDDGTKWDLFGHAIEGPRSGQRLLSTNSLMGFWMTFGSFYPGVEIFEGDSADPDASIAVSTNPEWLVPQASVVDGGPGKDGIPALIDMNFIPAAEVDYIQPEELVIGIKVGDDIKAYPHKILDWHEIANDKVDDTLFVAVTYCPLTGTASGWNRMVEGELTAFGVSGLLYNTNLMPYDRATDSYWSQMRFESVNGSRIGTKAKVEMLVESSWQTWKNTYPNSIVLSRLTGYNRDYFNYPYGNYRTNNSNVIFPLEYDDDRLGRKDRVHGIIINGEAKVYPLEIFE